MGGVGVDHRVCLGRAYGECGGVGVEVVMGVEVLVVCDGGSGAMDGGVDGDL